MEEKPNNNQGEEHVYDSANPLVSLPRDALISVLCRVPACNHMALWESCKALRETLDSDAYASERAATGWAEVNARLVPKDEVYDLHHPNGPELYGDDDDSYDSEAEGGDSMEEDLTEEQKAKRKSRKKRWEDKRERQRQEDLQTYYSDLGHRYESYGYDDIMVDIKVDGVAAGNISLALVPRGQHAPLFHEASDAHSGELQEVGWTLCDSRGRPKVRSIKQADTDGEAKSGGFLHVKSVRIRQAYRPLDNTNVVARAVRAALTVPELNGKWTLATAMSDARVYMTKEETNRRMEIRMDSFHGDCMADAAATENAKENKRLVERMRNA